ncbi:MULTISPECIES: LysM peptidoglycan-binding domain-containing protein [Spirosoma]|uniref:LysM peptidoglycan-binding domain-containing protein n=1 Tax=Spirosoma liriopis TaxID=2937440 RepID=A0ABT0HI50_9BACT|nr:MULTISPECIES: LysM domain-containing protein [Spirosoma]MCK8491680.1 LysM peptidoglycan-binding domain-containing protein [Spirosoma liriopis]UHG91040.1 LysM peptidoglycan-binding domain-containing protein [Spirosoma oryzicola]
METDNQTTNPRPTGSSGLPALTLIVLVGLIAALLYVGYEYISDDTNGSDELTNVALDTTSQQPIAQDNGEMLMAPENVDTSSQPAPVDLSQAEPPADAPEANAQAEEVAEGNRETTDGKPGPNEKSDAEKAAAEKAVVAKKEEKPKEEKPKEEKPKAEKPKEEVAIVKPKVKPGGVSTAYTVGSGETFYGVANRYNMKVSTLKALNPGVAESDVKAGVTKLNVKVMAVHTVGPGDVLRVVAQKYGVSKEAIMRANKRDKDIATRGERLIIPFPDRQ